ncbi:polysaccharide biosynthesis protein [Halobacillus fulvus]|nr:polysaccharide biosynthesis protein [Halobacillus fulvus]
MTGNQSQSIIKGALILALGGLISKVISAGYRVPLQNITGDLGFYIYQQVYPLLGLALILSLYGFPAAISKLVADVREKEEALSIPSFLLPALSILFLICGSVFLIGFTQAPRLAAVMGDEQLASSLRSAFFVFLFVPFLSIQRGVLQGYNYMAPTAVSQMTEQLVRVAGIIMTALLVIRAGNLYSIGIGASIAACSGALAGSIMLLFLMKKRVSWTLERWTHTFSYIRTIFLYGLFICLNYTLLLSLQWIDALTLVPGLVEAGVEQTSAREAKGVFDRGQPLIQLGTVLASSMALALIPSVTKKRMQTKPAEVMSSVFSATKFSLLIALGATVGLIVLFPSVNEVLFQNDQGTGALRILMIVVLFSSLTLTLSSILQSLERMFSTAFIILGGILVKGLLNVWLIPVFQLTGAALATILAVAFVLIGNIVLLGQEMKEPVWRHLPWLQMMVSILAMALVTGVLRQGEMFVEGRLVLLGYTLFIVAVGAFVYLLLLLKLGAFSEQEVTQLPLSKWWLRLLPKGMKS